MKELYKKYKREIWVGVVVSLITAAILKFGDWIVKIVPLVGVSVFEIFSNILYYLAATHSDNFLFSLLLFICFGFFVGTMAKPIIDSLKLYKAALRLENNTKKLSKDELDNINEQISTELKNEQKIEGKNISKLIKDGKKIGKYGIILIVMIAFSYIFINLFITAPMSLSNKFDQDIVKIAPYVEESDIKQLKSEWVCMRSKSDYDDIYKFIDEIKDNYSLPD